MIPTERPLDNPINWSFKLGRLWDINIRVHVTFLLGMVIILWMEIPRSDAPASWSGSSALLDALYTYAVLFAIVLLHEFGHCYGARKAGGEADEIMLWPLGGLAYVNPPNTPLAHLAVAAAGPMVNVAICGITCVILTSWSGTLAAVPWNPWHPTLPLDAALLPTAGQFWVMRVFGISYFLLLVNLLPIFPFDGGRILQAILWRTRGYAASIEIATGIGMVGAIGVGLVGLFHEQSWLLIGISLIGYATCWQTRRALREQGESFTGGSDYGYGREYTTTERGVRERRPGYFARLRTRRAAQRAERERLEENQRQQAVENVLRKVSTGGLTSLSARERRILEEETERRRKME